MKKELVKALEEARERGNYLRVQTNAPDARYSKDKKYFLMNCHTNQCVMATRTQKELIQFLQEQ